MNIIKTFANGFYHLSEWITRFAYLNLLWITFTVVGLGILGFMPATTSMFSVIKRWRKGEEDAKVFKTFWKSFKEDFIKANLVGYMIIMIGYVLSIEFKILRASSELIYFIGSYGVIALFILYLIVVMYFFPIFVHFNLKLTEYIKWAFLIGVIHPILTLFLLIILCAIYYVTFYNMPILLFLFGGSFSAWVLTWGVSKTFHKYEAPSM